MKKIDIRFNTKILKDVVGKEFTKYKCDSFDFTNSVTEIVGLYIGEKVYTLTNIQQPVNYYGVNEDIAIYKFNNAEDSEVKSAFQDTEMITNPVNGIVDKIVLVNEHQQIIKEDEKKYDVWLTRGIIFFVGGREISFEKDNIPFSEEIIIRKGYDLLKKFSDKDEFLKSWDTSVKPECSRNIVEIKKS